MSSKQFLLKSARVLAIASSIMILNIGMSEAQSMTLKVSHQFAAGDVRDQMGRVFGDMVTEKTNGEIKFRHYPAKSLFKPKEQWDAMRKGALDMSTFPLDYDSGKVPQLSITLMPCSVTNIKQGLSWRNKPIGQKIDAIMESNGVRNLVWAWFDGGIGSRTGLKMCGGRYEIVLIIRATILARIALRNKHTYLRRR